MDLAILTFETYESNLKAKTFFDKKIIPIQISRKKAHVLDPIFSCNYSYFEKTDILKLKTPNLTKGIISKIINYNNFEMIYQIDCVCYSGGSGGPIVNSEGQLVGVLFQNLMFSTKDFNMQLPNMSFIISKEVINELMNEISQQNPNFNNIWYFKSQMEEFENLFEFNKFRPKL
jgi:hypothetical protein